MANDPAFALDIRRARAAGRRALRSPWRATNVDYDKEAKALRLSLYSGICILIPTRLISELKSLRASTLRDVVLMPGGDALCWESKDLFLSVPGVLRELFAAASCIEFGRIGGRARSEKKTAAARMNGAKGGRPKKSAA